MYLISHMKTIIALLINEKVSIFEKLAIIIMIIYIVSPIDLIPFPVFGYNIIDDIIVLMLLVSFSGRTADKYRKLEELDINSENIVDNVEYEVNENDEDNTEK